MELQHVATPAGSLAVRTWPGRAPALVCLHGFTLHGGMFAPLAGRLPNRILAPDLPGHGSTTVDPVDFATTVAVVAGWLRTLERPPPLLGYSQGGRVALHVAQHHPEALAHLVLVSTATGLPPAARAARRRTDQELAQRIEDQGVAQFLDDWTAHPLVGTNRVDESRAAADRAIREENTAAGLAAALRGLGQGVMEAVDPARLTVPLTWIAGAHDERYAAAAQRHAAARNGTAIIVPAAGHNVVLEAPDALAAAVADVMDRV